MRACAAGVLLSACVEHVAAASIPFRRVRASSVWPPRAATVLDAGDPFGFQDLNSNVYAAEIVVQGASFTVHRFIYFILFIKLK